MPEHRIENELAEGSLIQLDAKMYSIVTMKLYAMRLIYREPGLVAEQAWQTLKTKYTENPKKNRKSPSV
ncbi:MAG: hypothetical protein H0U75_05445 [Legionella sp.]|nr:hypothetical protein [Legionella sp.]